MNTQKCCSLCGRKFVAVKSEDKKMTEDKAKAWRAIEVLDRFIASPDFLPRERTNPTLCARVVAAAEEEMHRLMAALDDQEALRAIYRRNERRKPAVALAVAA